MRKAAPWFAAFALALSNLFPRCSAFAQDPEAAGVIIRELAALGFENLAVDARPGTVTVWFENRVIRHELEALGEVAATASRSLDPDRLLELIPENRGVPLLCVVARAGDWRAFLEGATDPTVFRERLRLLPSRASGEPLRIPAGVKASNRRWWRTDLAIRPLIAFELGVADDPFQLAAWFAPEAVMSPARGVLLTAQGTIQLQDDIDPYLRTVAPGRNTLAGGGWLPWGCLAAANVGLFSDSRYGAAIEVGRLFANGAIELRGGGDKTGEIKFLHTVTVYSPIQAWSAYAAVTHRPRGIDLETTATFARFMEGEVGGRLDVARRFGEARVSFFAIQTREDAVLGVETLIPLPVRRWPRPRALRPVTVGEFPLTYRESVADIGRQVRVYDNLDRLRERLYPSYVWNNLDAVRRGAEMARGIEP
jgi:hypothetical protein